LLFAWRFCLPFSKITELKRIVGVNFEINNLCVKKVSVWKLCESHLVRAGCLYVKYLCDLWGRS
jgi:hypothetical protein